MSLKESRALLQRDAIKSFVCSGDQGRVLGFGGLSIASMHHRFEVDGRALSTWCDWDSLFIPEILRRPARHVARSRKWSVCHFIFFFVSRSTGERWVAEHPGTFLYSLDEAFALAKRFNAGRHGRELARR